jgi:small conductance mechanosensitive channel
LDWSSLLPAAAAHAAPNPSVARDAVAKLVDSGGDLAINIAVALVITVATLWLAGWAGTLTRAGLSRMHTRRGAQDPTLAIFAGSVVRNLVTILGFIAVLERLGVRTTSIVAVLGAASLAVGLALQGALANVAAGVMILFFRPYRIGDIIETAGRTGRVRTLDLFVTELATLDNLKVVIPNGKVFGDVIVNHTFHDRRRADAVLRLPLTADAPAVMSRLRERLAADPRVLKDPPPLIEMVGVSEAFFEVAMRPWVATADYGAVKADQMLWAARLERDPAAELPPPELSAQAPAAAGGARPR